jgi:hypothetical protein
LNPRWHIRLEQPVPVAVEWIRCFLERYDTSRLEWLRINHGSPVYCGVYGRCWLPTRHRPTYRISCQLPGPFPAYITTRRRPLYKQPDGSFPPVPRGCRQGQWLYDPDTGREWIQLRGRTRVKTLDEGVVWIFSHEAFHFLRDTRQVPGRNTEIEADAFADDQLALYRHACRATAGCGLQLSLL